MQENVALYALLDCFAALAMTGVKMSEVAGITRTGYPNLA